MDRCTSYYCPECDCELRGTEEIAETLRCPLDGATLFKLPEGLSPGVVIDGRYTIVKPLGRGGMGVVFLATQQSSGRQVALKLIGTLNDDELTLRRFIREAKAHSQITHPGVVEVFDFGQSPDGRPYMVMEVVDGEGLDEIIAREGAIAPRRATHLAAEIATALMGSHDLGILHRDLKPSNVIVRQVDGVERVKIFDFGLAKAVQDDTGELGTLTATGMLVGTPQYMSPEQYQCAKLGPATDFYSLGCVLYEMLTGRLPFPGDNVFAVMQSHVMDRPVPPSEVARNNDIPPEIERLTLQLLEKDAAKRFVDAETLVRDLRRLAGNGIDVHIVSSSRKRPPQRDSAEFIKADVPIPETNPQRLGATKLERFRPAMVGRDQICKFLDGVLRRCLDKSDPAVISLEGVGGVGKTKLLDWYRRRAKQGGFQVVRGFYAEGHLGPHAALKGVLEEILGVVGQSWEEIELKLDELVKGADPTGEDGLLRLERERLQRFLRPQSEGSAEDSNFAPEDRELLYATLLRVIHLAARAKPTLMIMDDLRDDRPFDVAFVEHLGLHLSKAKDPLLVVMAVRTGEEAARDEESIPSKTLLETAVSSLAVTLRDQLYRVKLLPLQAEEIEILAKRAIPGICDEASLRVADLAGGNPLFALELLRNMVAEGSLRRDGDRWVVFGEPSLPDDLDGVLNARLKRLRGGEGEEAILVRAALIGMRVPLDLLSDVLRREGNFNLLDDMDRILDRLVDDGWLRDGENWDEENVSFGHGFVHQALLERYANKRGARKIRLAVAEALEIYYADELEPLASQIAEHFLAGGNPARALPYLVQAARGAEERYDIAGSIDYWQRAEKALRSAGSDELTSANVRRGLSRMLIYDGQYDQAHQILEKLGDDAQSLLLRGTLAVAQAEFQAAREFFKQSLEGAREQGPTDLELQVILRLADVEAKLNDRQRSIELLEGVLAHLEAGGATRLRAEALSDLAMYVQSLGDFKRSLELLDEAEEMWRTLDDCVELGRCLYHRGNLHWRRSEFKKALNAYGEAIALVERGGHRVGLGHCLRMAGVTAQHLGRLDEALAYCNRAKEIFEAISDRRGLQQTALCFADVYSARGEHEKAIEWAHRALREAREMDSGHEKCSSLMTLGEVYLQAGDHEKAVEFFEEAMVIELKSGLTSDRRALLHQKYGEALYLSGKPDLAKTQFEQAFAIYDEIGNMNGAAAAKEKLSQF